MEKIATKAEEELASCESEEGAGMLRALSGKARLLVAEKLNQFRGLCHKNLVSSIILKYIYCDLSRFSIGA